MSETRKIRSKKSMREAITRSYDCRRDIATGPTKMQSAFFAAIERS